MIAMGTGRIFGVLNDSLAGFYFKVKFLATVLTLQNPCASVHLRLSMRYVDLLRRVKAYATGLGRQFV